MWDAAKVVVRRKFTGLNAYTKKKFNIYNLSFYLKKLRKEEQIKPKISGRNSEDNSRSQWNGKKQ